MVNRAGIKVCDVLMLDATRNFDWIGLEGSGEVSKVRDLFTVLVRMGIFERNCAMTTWEISEMYFEMNCCEIRAEKCT